MKLEGSLDAFGLPDVFHLLQATGKTGGLWLRRDEVEAVVHLDAGQIAGAAIDPSRLALLRRLVMCGAVDEDAIAEAAGHAGEHGTGLVAALLALDLVDEPVATTMARALVVDVVFDLLRWPDGDFSFVADETPNDDVGLRLTTAEAVDEARSRLARWEEASAAIPSPAWIPSLSETVVPNALTMTTGEWSVLALIDGRRSVSDIVELMAVGAFDVVTVLADLVARGLVEIAASPEEVALTQRLRRLELMRILDAAASTGDQPSVPAQRVPAPSEPVPAADQRRPAASTGVIPERPEPFLPTRMPDHPEPVPARASARMRNDTTTVMGANAVANAPLLDEHVASADGDVEPAAETAPEDFDPLFNRSLVLRLIAGVRGL